nr:MAG TPA: hypothetical protein [Caudoviricetes sp.]
MCHVLYSISVTTRIYDFCLFKREIAYFLFMWQMYFQA